MVTSQTAVPSTRPSQSIWPGRVAGLSSSLAGQGGTRGSGGPVCTSLRCLPRTEPVKCFVTWCGPRAAWAGAMGQGEGRGERAGRGGTRTLGGRGTLEGGARHWGLGGWESARDRDLPPWPGLSFPTWKWAGPAGAGHPQSRARKEPSVCFRGARCRVCAEQQLQVCSPRWEGSGQPRSGHPSRQTLTTRLGGQERPRAERGQRRQTLHVGGREPARTPILTRGSSARHPAPPVSSVAEASTAGGPSGG